MLARHRTILATLAELGGGMGAETIHAVLFQISRSEGIPPSARHDFVACRQSATSFTLDHDLRRLTEMGLIRVEEGGFQLTSPGWAEHSRTSEDLRSSAGRVARNSGWRSDSGVTDRNCSKIPVPAGESAQGLPAFISTVGYEGIAVEGLLGRLLEAEIAVLADVRCNPVARRYGFHRSTLSTLCSHVGIDYVHVPELGVPSSWRESLDDRAALDALFCRYRSELLPCREPFVERLADLSMVRSTALLCKEADPHCCHRSELAAVLSQRTGLPIRHLRDFDRPD